MNNKNIPERTEKSLAGLKEMIDYIKSFVDTKELTIVEVGCWTGISACLFAEHFKQVIAVDTWNNSDVKGITDMTEIEALFDERTSKYTNIKKSKGDSLKKAKLIKNYDIVYIDAGHTYEQCKSDIEAWNKAKVFTTGHDYWKNKFDGVIKAVDEAFGKPDKTFPDTSWVVRVKENG